MGQHRLKKIQEHGTVFKRELERKDIVMKRPDATSALIAIVWIVQCYFCCFVKEEKLVR